MTGLLTTHDFHGLLVRVEGGPAAEPARRLLSWFPAGPDDGSEPHVVVRARSVPRGISRGECPKDAQPIFFHGPVQVFAQGSTILVHDGSSLITVSENGRFVDAAVSDASLERSDAFEDLPLVIALVVALRHHGLFHVHSGAVIDAKLGRVLIAGQSGAGKTTVTLAFTLAGADYLADDTVFLATRDGVLKVLPLLRCFHVADRTAAAFALSVDPAGTLSLAGKAGMDPRRAFPSREHLQMLTPDVLLFPQIGIETATAVSPLAPAEALGCLMQSSALVVVDRMARVPDHLDLLRKTVNAARSYRVVLGQDLLQAPNGVVSGLRRVCGASD